MSKKTVLITGSSTGIGRATSILFQKNGWQVSATMRNPEKEKELTSLDNLICLELDVTKPETIKKAIIQTIEKFGKIDVIVNNAGYAINGLFEAGTIEQIKEQYNTNVFGLMDVTKNILPIFRKQKAGTIINISSIGGKVGFPLYSIYNSTKFAVEGFSEGLLFEVEPFNIKIKLIEPGVIKTDFYGRSALKPKSIIPSEYEKFTENIHYDISKGTLPEKVAKVIYKAAISKNNNLRYPVGSDANLVCILKKLLPFGIFREILKKVLSK